MLGDALAMLWLSSQRNSYRSIHMHAQVHSLLAHSLPFLHLLEPHAHRHMLYHNRKRVLLATGCSY